MRRFFFKTFILFYALVVTILGYFRWSVNPYDPQWELPASFQNQVEVMDSTWIRYGNNWLHQNDYGIWEMYLEGSALERGVAHGKLTQPLMEYQEQAFVDKIFQLIPSEGYLQLLRNLIGWFNRDMEQYIPLELKQEIYGISRSAHPKFDIIAAPYRRMLNYHGAHDIGHALQNLALVGCTSFATNLNDSLRPQFLGRNFDFYVSDDFARNVIVCRVVPDSGYAFTYITWASFAGVVSGMNDCGLTVTINAAKSTYPLKSAMPISLLAREIVQYASNLDQAISIAQKRKLFVSESIQIASAQENQSIIIEVTPTHLEVVRGHEKSLICANHFQSEALGKTELNLNDMQNGPSLYRFTRAQQLIAAMKDSNIVNQMAQILRNRDGIDQKNLGLGNEKAMNQLISHHSIIFEPDSLTFWISSPPFQLGPYLAYKNTDFIANYDFSQHGQLYQSSQTIAADPFLYSIQFQQFLLYRKAKAQLQTALFKGDSIALFDAFAQRFVQSNPNYYYVYQLVGDYYFEHHQGQKALHFYQKSLNFENEYASNRNRIKERISKIHEQQKR
jgi:predicted choloylglycine hydrolase